MVFSAWLSAVRKHFTSRKQRQHVRRVPPSPRWLERLEDRTLLTTISWANDSSGSWNDPSNWSSGVVPGSGEDVVIDRAAGDFTITVSFGTSEVHRLVSTGSLVISMSWPEPPASDETYRGDAKAVTNPKRKRGTERTTLLTLRVSVLQQRNSQFRPCRESLGRTASTLAGPSRGERSSSKQERKVENLLRIVS